MHKCSQREIFVYFDWTYILIHVLNCYSKISPLWKCFLENLYSKNLALCKSISERYKTKSDSIYSLVNWSVYNATIGSHFNITQWSLRCYITIKMLKYILLQCHYMFRADEAIFRRRLCVGISALRTNQM
jgi:hypothetical protein